MNKLFIFIISLIVLVFPKAAYAQTGQKLQEKIVVVTKDKVINQDYFAAGQTVEIYGVVNGDIYAAGANLIIDGVVNGDVLAAGGTISVSGKVSQNIRVVGGQINLSGDVGRNVSLAGGNINLEKTGVIAGNLTAAAGNVMLSGKINQNVQAAVGNLRIAPSAGIGGNLNYISDKQASIDTQALIAGKVTHQTGPKFQPPQVNKEQLMIVLASIFVGFKILSIFTSLILGLLIVNLFPKYSGLMTEALNQRPWHSLIIGLVFMVIAPIVLIILAVTIIGLPLAVILFILYFLLMYVARILFMYWLGIKVLGLFGKKVVNGWAVVSGTMIFGIFSWIQPLGFILSIGGIFALGAAITSKKNLYDSLRKKNLI